MDILSEIEDEVNTSFKLYQDEYTDGPISYGTSFDPEISIKYLDTIQRAINYYHDETGEEIIAKIDFKLDDEVSKKEKIRWVFFFRNDNNEIFFFQKNRFYNDSSIFLSRKGKLTLK